MSLKALRVEVARDVLSEERAAAAAFRDDCARRGILVVHLISSPGAGKTSLLESTAQLGLGDRMAVLVGDIATQRDAQRLAPWTQVQQLTTGGACHLAFGLVEQACARLEREEIEFLFIEDVGNLVCPASFDLGQHRRVVLLSVPEGDDKPGKYPKAFRTSQALVITKTDLLPHVPFSVERAAADARSIQPELAVIGVSSLRVEGLEAWRRWLEEQRKWLVIRPR